MPLYEYECLACGRRTETLQRMDDPPLAICPDCGGALKKLISTSGFHFKGSGWYATDYARQNRGDAAKAEGAAKEASADAGKPAATSESKESKETSAAKPAAETPSKNASS